MAQFPDELVRDVVAHPGDEAPYLVLADWLQGVGDPRGELITLQHQMSVTSDTTEFLRLKARVDELLAAHVEHFYGEVTPDPAMKVQWRWGFLYDVALTTERIALIDHPSAVVLRRLYVAASPAVSVRDDLQADIDALAARERVVRRLTLDAGWLGTVGDLTALPSALPALEQLFVEGHATAEAWTFPALQELEICGESLEERHWRAVFDTAPATLTRLRLIHALDPDAMIAALVDSDILDRLESVSIDSPSSVERMVALIERVEPLRVGITFESELPALTPEVRERLIRLAPDVKI